MARNSFNPDGDATVTKAFRFAGAEYAVGDRFPWRDLGENAGKKCPLGENDLRGLWLADLIDFVDTKTAHRIKAEEKDHRRARAEAEVRARAQAEADAAAAAEAARAEQEAEQIVDAAVQAAT